MAKLEWNIVIKIMKNQPEDYIEHILDSLPAEYDVII